MQKQPSCKTGVALKSLGEKSFEIKGGGLEMCIMYFFSCLKLFKHTVLNSMSLAGCRTWCSTDLQHLCCKALVNKQCLLG